MAKVNEIPLVNPIYSSRLCLPGNVVLDSKGQPMLNADGSYMTSGVEQLDPGPAGAGNFSIPNNVRLTRSFLFSYTNPSPSAGIDRFGQLQVKAIMSMLGQALSGFSYRLVNGSDQLGKYQFSALQLYEQGYIKLSYYNQYGPAAVKYNYAWTGRDGMINANTWLLSGGIQEKAMFRLLASNYNYLTLGQIIKSSDNLCTAAGMLSVAHILGIDGARTWRATGQGKDPTGNTGGYFFSLGRYAIDVLSYTANS
jgi:hypothetical protein